MNIRTHSTKIVLCAVLASLLVAVTLASKPVRSISGKWSSDWGTVTFKQIPMKNSSKFMIKGFWDQPGSGIGQVTAGTYDPATRRVEFSFYQPWNCERGTTSLVMSRDGKKLVGTWQHSMASGSWNMSRK